MQGLIQGDRKVYITHGIGHLISLFYCYQFTRNCPDSMSNLPGKVKHHQLASVSIALVVALSIFLLGNKASVVIGTLSICLSCTMYIGPLTRLREAISTRSARNIPLPFAIMGFINSFAWTIYGFFELNDVVHYGPCSIGAISTGAQILVNLLYND